MDYPNLYGRDFLCFNLINYVITESEVVAGKSQTEALRNTIGRGLRFPRNDRKVEVIKLFIIWLTKRF